MSALVLVAFATRYGSTREVADAVARTLVEEGVDAGVVPGVPAGDARDWKEIDAWAKGLARQLREIAGQPQVAAGAGA